jgi:hypothetical protein
MEYGIMAGSDDTAAGNGSKTDLEVEARTSALECRLLLEAGRVAIETIAGRDKPATPEELGVIFRLLGQASDALESCQRAMQQLFGAGQGLSRSS